MPLLKVSLQARVCDLMSPPNTYSIVIRIIKFDGEGGGYGSISQNREIAVRKIKFLFNVI